MYIPCKRLKIYFLLFIIFISTVVILNNKIVFLKTIYPLKYKDIVYKNAMKNELDPYLVFAIIKAESNFDKKAVSHKNAKGLMQISDETANEVAKEIKIDAFTQDDLYEPEKNIMIGTWYIRWLMDQFNGNTDLVIAAYNGGIGNVQEWLLDKNLSKTGTSLDKIPFKETEKFLIKVKSYHKSYKHIYEKSSVRGN